MKFEESIKIEAVTSIVKGDLNIKEVMQKYQIKKKKTVVDWIIRLLPTVTEQVKKTRDN
ncbi:MULTISPECIES: hypothetical protein [unclassified Sphingobacterium]|uniref:hypothetical protein n=1 Tax=unclassified Sphingobacterium TaxID=2609468 RepID=UPI0020C45ACC|nr:MULTISPECIES: hypothetical protein [unclassified Sphingobacterium]